MSIKVYIGKPIVITVRLSERDSITVGTGSQTISKTVTMQN
tara:strand:+ start:2419 stop:2541 length:123 start_codon:yes stop_codon:yes gene_type:complete